MSDLILRDVVAKIQDLLQCTICFNIPEGNVFNCPTGHSVCEECYGGLRNCPSCGQLYNKTGGTGGGSRNFALENILEYNREVLTDIVKQTASDKNKPVSNPEPERTFLWKEACLYNKNGCKTIHRVGKFSESPTHLQMVQHAKECPTRPIECVVPPLIGWRYDTDYERKRFCGPSENVREAEKLMQRFSSIPLFEMRSRPQEIPWENYIEHLQTDHGAKFSFERVSEFTHMYMKLDSIICAPGDLSNLEISWPLDLINANGLIFIRHRFIHKGEIQNQIFMHDTDTPYIATIKVSKAFGNTQELVKLRTINILPMRDFGLELLKRGWQNPRHDTSYMDASFVEQHYNVQGLGLENDPTYAWYTWIEFQLKSNSNPIPFNTTPNLVEQAHGGPMYFNNW